MAFMSLKTIVFKNKIKYFNFAFLFFFVYLLRCLVNYKSHIAILLSWYGAIVQNLIIFKNSL